MKRHKDRSAGTNGETKGIVAADFPAVREFLSGYLNQDFADEYGTVEEATKAFCGDANTSEIQELANEWGALTAFLGGGNLERINGVLSGTFHGGWRVTDRKQLDVISEILQKRTS